MGVFMGVFLLATPFSLLSSFVPKPLVIDSATTAPSSVDQSLLSVASLISSSAISLFSMVMED